MLRTGPSLLVGAAILLHVGGQATAQPTVGLLQNDEATFDGYTLFAPMQSTVTYLIGTDGKLVHSWGSTV